MGKIIINVDWTDNYAAAPENEDIACVTTGRTFEELKKNMEEALRFHIEGMQEDGEAIPAEFSGEWEFEWHMTTAAMLHYVEKTVPKSAISKVTGINQQQLTHYASGWRRPRPDMRKRILDGIHAIGKELIAIS